MISFKEFIYESISSKKYYHITPKSNLKDIKKNGIKCPSDYSIFLTDSYEKSILWMNIIMDEVFNDDSGVEENENYEWCVIVVNNIDDDLLTKVDYHDIDFLEIHNGNEEKGDFVVDELKYSKDIPPENIIDVMEVERYTPYEEN